MIELRCGRWQDVLLSPGGVWVSAGRSGGWYEQRPDVIIQDPPYSARTHAGQRTGSRPLGGGGRKTTIEYEGIDESNVTEICPLQAAMEPRWICTFSDHTAQRWWERSLQGLGMYVFAPVAWVRSNPTPRLFGDGPTSSLEYITIARPKKPVRGDDAGSRPGHYLGPCDHVGHAGAKPLWLMRAIIRDYTKPGDLIVDPFAGSGTTLIAARAEGRDCIGAECDPKTYELAMRRIEKPFTREMFL